MADIIVAEDEESIREGLVLALQSADHIVRAVSDGAEALAEYRVKRPDLILLDVMMPKKNGYDVCKAIRKKDPLVPILFLTAKTTESCTVHGLELGADDYMIKPFDSKEMVARVKAVLRRYDGQQAASRSQAASDEQEEVVRYTDLEISLSHYSVTYMGSLIEMPPKELELLYFLASHPNQVFTREQLLDRIWGYEYIGETRTIDVHIKRIREKINDHKEWALTTVWGIGYKFETTRC